MFHNLIIMIRYICKYSLFIWKRWFRVVIYVYIYCKIYHEKNILYLRHTLDKNITVLHVDNMKMLYPEANTIKWPNYHTTGICIRDLTVSVQNSFCDTNIIANILLFETHNQCEHTKGSWSAVKRLTMPVLVWVIENYRYFVFLK